jgi:hypothetical protein
MNYFAGSFLMSGIKTFVGTNWEVVDNERTLDFTIRFYLSIFNHKSIGESLFVAREHARRHYEPWDLTWANYTLHGVPDYSILSIKKENRYRILNPSAIKKSYPTPIARSYSQFIEVDHQKTNPNDLMQLLINSFNIFSNIIGSIVFSDHKNQSMGKISPNDSEKIDLSKWWELIYSSMWNFKRLEISMFMESLMEVLSLQREMVFKMINWIEQFNSGELESEFVQGYLVTFQYYYENLLAELSEFENCMILYFPESASHYFSFNGFEPKSHFILGSSEWNTKQILELNGKFSIFHKSKNSFLPLYGFELKEDINHGVEMVPVKINIKQLDS